MRMVSMAGLFDQHRGSVTEPQSEEIFAFSTMTLNAALSRFSRAASCAGVLGIATADRQALYHFAIGRGLADERITTTRAYGERSRGEVPVWR